MTLDFLAYHALHFPPNAYGVIELNINLSKAMK
jgi:hypothetical protein